MPPYTYEWSNQQNSKDIIDVKAGNYTIKILDQQGTKLTYKFTITEPKDILLLNSEIKNTTSGKTEGNILLNLEGGVLPYTYLWSNGANTNPVIDLGAGEYYCELIDANKCSKDFGPFTIGELTSSQTADQLNKFELIPNPVTKYIELSIKPC